MAAVRPDAPARQEPGIDDVGNDTGKALSLWAYHEATECTGLSISRYRREWNIIDYDSRRTGNGSLDAGSTPAYSMYCGKEGPTEWEDSLSRTRGKEGPTEWEDSLSRNSYSRRHTGWRKKKRRVWRYTC